MTRLLRIQADLAFDSKTLTPNLDIPLNVVGAKVDLVENLSLKVANNEDLIVTEGVFNFKITAGLLGISNSDFINITIEVYRTKNRITRAYYTQWQGAGLTINAGNFIMINVPIQFTERVTIPVTTDIAEYYVSIFATATTDELATIVLEECSYSAMEIASEVKINYCGC